MDYPMVYDIIYALAARDGREAALFGSNSSAAHAAFVRSVAGPDFPELWFEIPLSGEAWFDLHALTTRGNVSDAVLAAARETTPAEGGAQAALACPEAFAWLAKQQRGARQLALSWDVGSGDALTPAVQLLVENADASITCSFLKAVGRADAVEPYRRFLDRLPRGWFACYTGVFPSRPGHNLRVECIPDRNLQHTYAGNAGLLEADLRQLGLEAIGDTLVQRSCLLAQTPFHFEFQFDVLPDGRLGSTVGVSVRFASPAATSEDWQPFDPDGAGGTLMRQAQAWGLVDERWQHLAGTSFAKRATRGNHFVVMYCYPAFLKLRWREGEPLDAKAYLIAGVQEER